MAGDWIKMECSLPDKPETLAITAAMGWEDPDLTVGKLMRVFRWFDQQTVNGNAAGVTATLLDRVIGVTGFVQAMCGVGWIVVTDTGLFLHNFDRHNGETAKKRAQTAKRVANHRSNANGNAEGNAVSVTEALAREEKRREEREDSSAVPATTEKASRKSSMPAEFYPNDAGIKAAEVAGFDVKAELAKFCDHHAAQGSKFSDWQAAFRTWIRKAIEFRGGKKAAPVSGEASWLSGTPYTNVFEANNAGCFAHNAAKFRTEAHA